MAAHLNQALVAALTGQDAALVAQASDLIAQVDTVGPVISGVMHRPGITLAQQWRVTRAIRKAGIDSQLLDALASTDPATRSGAAKLCGALRLADAVPWLSDLLQDAEPTVRDAAATALGRTGGRRAVDALMTAVDRFPAQRLAADIARGASDIDLDGLLRSVSTPQAGVVVALACGLRADVLRFPRLVAIARDPNTAVEVRAAACRALGMIGDRAAAGVLRNLSTDANPVIAEAATHALRRYRPAQPRRSA